MKRIALLFLVLSIESSALGASGEAKENFSKVVIDTSYLFAQPNASAPAQVVWGFDSEIIEEYEETALASVRTSQVAALKQRSAASSVEVRVRDEYDKIFINGRMIDARLGIARSLPDEKIDPAFAGDEHGAWIVQFHGPI